MLSVETLARCLSERRHEGVVVPFVERSIGSWRPEAGQCHHNADFWVLNNPEYRAVHGWICIDHAEGSKGIFLYVEFLAHSLVEGPGGELMDITPSQSSQCYPFIRHEGTREDFISLVEGQQITCIRHHIV